MSNHYFATEHKGHPVTVNLGWDRPLSYFFMVITKPAELLDESQLVDDEDYLYSNLHEQEPFEMDLDYYRQVLNHFGISVPESMFKEAEEDMFNDVGNRVVTHQADGTFTESSM
ncbi:hypothetical protein [Achromobacter xylosoxidans]|uniref:hypothetical protein n=1 Tax=Alcaligenes xylosoxydans xylosoxydans TaxID=85698 RepID=UPI00047DA820|nr:hypothetical protein [Achromobacter xylosoxidans]